MTYEVYRSRSLFGKRWSWRLKAVNSRIIAVAGENFHNRQDVLDIVETMKAEAGRAQVKVLP